MEIIIKAKNIELTDSLERFINDKIGKLEKFLSYPGQEIFIEIEKETKHHKKGEVFSAEGIISVPGKKIMAIAKPREMTGRSLI